MENTSRRRALVGLAGSALGLVGSSAVSAGRDPVTVPPPLGPTAADAELLGAVQAVELAARDLYRAAVDAGADDDVYLGIGENHQAYADVLSGLLGRAAPGRRDEALYEADVDAFEQGGEELATAAYDLESTLVATHTALLAELEGVDGAKTLASILMMEARHCTVLADMAGRGDDLDALLVNTARPVDLQAGGQG